MSIGGDEKSFSGRLQRARTRSPETSTGGKKPRDSRVENGNISTENGYYHEKGTEQTVRFLQIWRQATVLGNLGKKKKCNDQIAEIHNIMKRFVHESTVSTHIQTSKVGQHE